jgi:hypothetical protein
MEFEEVYQTYGTVQGTISYGLLESDDPPNKMGVEATFGARENGEMVEVHRTFFDTNQEQVVIEGCVYDSLDDIRNSYERGIEMKLCIKKFLDGAGLGTAWL